MTTHPLEPHRDRNRQTRDQWDHYQWHRRQITQLLVKEATTNDRSLCVLGAGNANDLDLVELTGHFSTVTLVDWDGEALAGAKSKLNPGIANQVQWVADVDLTGILESLHGPSWTPDQPLDELIERAKQVSVPSPLGRYDVVASTCLLTQLIGSVLDYPGDAHPATNQLALAIRDGHLHLMDQLIAPGGRGVLITDVVSSDTLPELLTTAGFAAPGGAQLLEQVLLRAVQSRNFFTGANPVALYQQLMGRFDNPRVQPPWIWQMGNRSYAVCALTMDHRQDNA